MRYDNLQCFRALAAAAVVVMHAPFFAAQWLGTPPTLGGPWEQIFTGGLAVVVFFALSGFVLAHALRAGSIRGFVGLRLLRLYPAYWAACALALVAHFAVGTRPPQWELHAFASNWRTVWLPLTLLPPGPASARYVLGPEWTLVYEVCLSLALAVIAAMVGRRRGLGVVVAVWLVLCLGKQLVKPVVYNGPIPPRLADWPLSVANVPFLLGVLAYLTLPRWGHFRRLAPPAAAAALAGAALVPIMQTGWSNVLQGLAAALAIGWAATARQLRPEHPLVKAGDWSYGMYLLHCPILIVFFALATTHLPPTGATVVLGGIVAITIGSAFGAAESAGYRWGRAALRRGLLPPAFLRPGRRGGLPVAAGAGPAARSGRST
jgi:peptidoglycan/LPS O-acetylase OafA/YrhL